MAVVTIVGMMAVSVMPSITEMIASTRQHAAANDIMLLARRARREAVLGGKYAYALLFLRNAGGGNGAIQVATGVTGHCDRATAVNFGNDPFTGIPLGGWQSAVGAMSIGEFSFSAHRVFGTMEMPQGAEVAGLSLCYAANGETHVSAPGIPTAEQANPAVLFIRRSTNGVETGIPREVVFMPGGTARIR